MKEDVRAVLDDLGIEIIDHGTFHQERVDFPDLARKVCRSIQDGVAQRGIMLCGSGIGATIAANKFQGIRACVCHDVYSAHQGVEHDDMNVLCLGSKIIGPWLARDLITAFAKASFSTDAYFRARLVKLEQMELDAARQTCAGK
jgi:ribose 5-phosphate isomerase B